MGKKREEKIKEVELRKGMQTAGHVDGVSVKLTIL